MVLIYKEGNYKGFSTEGIAEQLKLIEEAQRDENVKA